MVKVGNDYQYYTVSSSTYSSGSDTGIVVYKRLKDQSDNYVNIFKKFDLTADAASITSDDIVDWFMFDCSSGCKRTYGYIKTTGANSKTFSIPYSGSNSIVTAEIMAANACTAATDIGKLLTGGLLCMLNHATAGSQIKPDMSTANGKIYLLSNENSNIFTSSSTGTSIVIKGTSSSFTLSHVDTFNVYKIIDNQITVYVSLTKTDFTTTGTAQKIGLYQCNSNVCKGISGYIYETTDSIYYSVGSTPGVTAVSPSGIDMTSNSYCSSKVGHLIKDQANPSNLYLCLGDASSVLIPAAGIEYYKVNNISTNSKLASNKMAMVNANKYIVVDGTLEGNYKFVKKK